MNKDFLWCVERYNNQESEHAYVPGSRIGGGSCVIGMASGLNEEEANELFVQCMTAHLDYLSSLK
jgi:hypothetical protein